MRHVAAMYSTEWAEKNPKNNQPEVAVAVVAIMSVVAAAMQHCCSSMQHKMELAEKTKNNQPEVAVAVMAKVAAAVVAKVAAAVVAWQQLPCDIVAAMCSAE